MTAVLEHLRAHRPGADVPPEYLANLGERARNRALAAPGLSKNLTAAMAGVDTRTYWAFEHRGLSSPETLRTVAAILGVSRAQHAAMWRWTRRPVPLDLQPPACPADTVLADQLTGAARHPAVWLTPEWDVISANEPARAHLRPLALPGTNWAETILGPGLRARHLLTSWEGCARPMLEALRTATVDPARSPRIAQIALEVRQHRPTADLWDSCADMREGLDGMTMRALLPGLSPVPCDLRLSALSYGGALLVVLRPMVVLRRVDRGEASRAIPSAQQLADSVVELGATVGVVNYPLPNPNPGPDRAIGPRPVAADGRPPDLDVRLRRAAVAAVAGYTIAPGFLRPGAAIPGFPGTSAEIARHLRGEPVLCASREAMEAAVGGRPELIRALIPDPAPGTGGPRIGRVAHAALTVPDPDAPGGLRILGSVEAHRSAGQPPFTTDQLDRLRYLASVRGEAMAQEAEAARGIWGRTA
jgi:hypothetical protein